MDYFINEGNRIGTIATEFGTTGNSMTEKKLLAGADILKGQVVVLSASLTVVPASAASKFVLGVAMNDAKNGKPVAVETEGLVALIASAAITAPAEVESAAAGKVATAGGTPVKVIGIALNTVATGEKVYVKLSI